MIQIKNLTVKNFMSVGAATQGIDFDRNDLTLVLGENLDLGGDGSRNGTGKTTIINALSYALYGQALSNIRKDNLVNKTNGKNMLVSLDFSVNSQDYRIERGRKPNVLRFYINNEHKAAEDEAQGDSRETQDAIERVMNMSHDMFKHVLALNTYTEPFLSLKANDQRTIIEQLLGITLLSERADAIKELNRQTKDAIQAEEFRIRAVQEANKRIEEQIESLRKRQRLWTAKRDEDVGKLAQAIADLEHIDIDAEVQAHRDLEEFHVKKKALDDAARYIRQIDTEDVKLNRLLDKLKTEIEALDAHRCHSCGQDLHDDKQDELKQAKQALVQETALQLLANDTQRQEHEDTITQIGTLGTAPTVFYDSLEQALNHRNTVETLRKDLTSREADTDTYEEQITDMQGQALQVVSYDALNELTRVQDHQDFLLKLLTSKDSFVRKKIIDQNLSYLNARLTHYLDRIGLPHTVKFQNDLTVSIEELGRELDFDNLSRGERNRLILSMSWAFRDVWESLYSPINLLFIDELIDNGLDTQGVENALALLKKMSRERHKSIWLVSHRDELAGRVENILKVIKENGFTSYNTDVELA
ncbi:AAA family ATPase [Haliscomenobacter sp.]|uniref:AAA family ATPase n=1 Tax=Haliscomenobacter sp. TaxID=2717303 RepID=UPI003364BF0B